jgi:hypothetical protein
MAGTLTISTLSDGTNSTSATNCIQGSAKAWVNFNGTGTVAIRASYNVSSITDVGTGQYRVNFTNAMPNANYCVLVQAGENSYTTNWSTVAPVNANITTSLVEVGTTNGTSATDSPFVNVAIFSS